MSQNRNGYARYFDKFTPSEQAIISKQVKHMLYEYQGDMSKLSLSIHAQDRRAQGRIYDEEAFKAILEGSYSIYKLQFNYDELNIQNVSVVLVSGKKTTLTLPSKEVLEGNLHLVCSYIPHKSDIITFVTPGVDQF